MWVRRLGSIANQQIQRVSRARVIGLSSAGVFVQLDPGPGISSHPPEPSSWVVFLSPGRVPGPLTLNLAGAEGLAGNILPGDEIIFHPGRLSFPRLDSALELSRASIWQAPPAATDPGSVLSPAERRTRLGEVVRLAVANRPASGWSALLPVLAADVQPDWLAAPMRGLPDQLIPAIRELRSARKEQDGSRLAGALSGLIGLGNGLTPSGDDLALGLLLLSSRWGEILLPGLDRAELASRVVRFACQATTNLSASLIACAALGQADPRLLAAVDGLVTGRPEAAECAAGLAAWGSSSGLDALLGMSVMI